MNCQEIARTLDSRDVNRLSAAERSACEAHASSCLECGPTWAVYTRLAAIPVPAMAADLAARCETLVVAQGKITNFRRVRRVVVIGTVLVLAAAAAMLSLQRVDRQVVAAVEPVAPVAVKVDDAGPADTPSVPVTAQPVKADNQPEPMAPAIKPFTVRVLPLQNNETNAAGKAAITALYHAFIERLRTTPGVVLVETELAADGTPVRAEYRITLTGEPGNPVPGAEPKAGGEFNAEILSPTGTPARGTYGGYSVDIAPGCVTDPRARDLEVSGARCRDATGVAAELVGQLRTGVFPPDPALRRELQARLLDRSLGEKQRQKALLDLAYFGAVNGGRIAITTLNPALRDPAVIRGAVDLATTATDPELRASVWNLYRGSDDAELITPLLGALERDPQGLVRLAALGALAEKFGTDPRVQAAFNAAAGRDAQPLVRALAQRAADGVAGDATWRRYISDSLKDPGRSAVERIEALFFEMNLPVASGFRNRNATIQPAMGRLDDEAIRSLAEVLPKAAADSPIVQRSADELLRSLGNLSRPASVTELLLAIVEARSPSLGRITAVQALAESAKRQYHQGAYAALEKLTADPDPRVRDIAAVAVKGRASMPPTNPPQRLGVNMAPMQAAPDVPGELVGMPLILLVVPGSVAEAAGVQGGDILVGINGKPIVLDSSVVRMIEALPKGVDIELLVRRKDQQLRLIARF